MREGIDNQLANDLDRSLQSEDYSYEYYSEDSLENIELKEGEELLTNPNAQVEMTTAVGKNDHLVEERKYEC